MIDRELAALTSEVRARVAELGFELVDIRQRGAGSRIRLQLRVDRPDSTPGRSITIDECATVSRAIEAWLDASGVLGTQYVLEVSSPGIERPVRWREHWERFRGRDVHVRIRGRHRMRATIVAVRGDDVVVLRPSGGGAPEDVALDDIQEATLAVEWETVERAAAKRKHH
ncbi:MAG: ribosome maturation factor RimP [Gemmatimonadales bacterium]|nr:ribosome maturation factor RimP [Gemmatimonadales bacterium]